MNRWPHPRRSFGVVSQAFYASRQDLEAVRISRRGLHWDKLDEDISIAGLLAGLNHPSQSDAA